MNSPSIQDLMHEARQAEHLGRFDLARDMLRQVAAAGESPLALDARLRLGKLLIYGGTPHYAEAEQILTTSRAQAERAAAPRQTAAAIHLLALLERRRGHLDRAQGLLDQSPALKLSEAPGPETAQLFQCRGLLAADRNELANAERLYFRAHQLYQELHHEAGLAEVCDALANLMLKKGRSRRALGFAQASLEMKEKLRDRYGQAISLGTLGRAYLLQARYLEAREVFRKDLALATELGDQQGIGIMLNSLGEVAQLSKDLSAARDYYRQNLAVDRGPYNAIHAYLGLARAHLAANELEEAAAAADRMEDLLSRNPRVSGLADALSGVRGALAWRRGALPEGERLLTQAVESLRKQQQELDTIPYLYELRDLYQSKGSTQEAVKVMAQALDLLSECGAERGVEDVEEWLRSVDSPSLVRLSLERHFPDYLVEGILAGQLGRWPTRRQEVTVLFSDVRGYTTLSEGLPPEEVVELLNEWFAEATRAIRQHGGVVDKFIGDAVMALFGVPEPREDAADGAVRSALAMRDALAALNLRHKALGGKEIRVGIGIHTGEAVVGFIGSHLRQSYTAIGDVVNVASRLESATKDFSACDILISQETEKLQQRSGAAETEFLGYVTLKGRMEKVGVYGVRGRKGVETGI